MKRTYFIVFLSLMVIGGATIFIGGQKTYSANENRYLSTIGDIRKTDDVEKVLTDQFAGRDLWLSLTSGTKYILGNREINNTYIGKDGYLFDACAQWDFAGENYTKNLDYVNRFASNYGCMTDVVLVPSPAVVLADKLPAHANIYDAEACYEEAARALTGKASLVDLRESLKALGERTQVYYHSDHHWTTAAAAEAYRVLGGSRSEEEMKLESVTDEFYGTMYSRVLLPNSACDTIEALPDREDDTLYDPSKLETKDKYAFFLGGNSARVDISGTGKGRLLVIKDSFANCMIPFWTADYATITVVDLRYFNASLSELMAEGYDRAIVLYEMTNFAADQNLHKIAKK